MIRFSKLSNRIDNTLFISSHVFFTISISINCDFHKPNPGWVEDHHSCSNKKTKATVKYKKLEKFEKKKTKIK